MKKRKFNQQEKVMSHALGHCYGMTGHIVEILGRMPGTAPRYRVKLDRTGQVVTWRESWMERADG